MAGTLELPSESAMLQDSTDKSAESEIVTFAAKNIDKLWQPILQEVWDDEMASDMTLHVAGTKYKVHRLVMMVYSSDLRRRIKKADQSLTHLEVDLNMDPVLVKKTLDFMYEGTVDVAKSQLLALSEVAGLLGIDTLRNSLVQEYLRTAEVTSENCLSLWQAASQAKCEKLANDAKVVALKNFSSLQHSASFKALSDRLVQEYLGSAGLVTGRAEERLLAALHWVQVDPTNRHKHLCSILDNLPLSTMGWFLDHVLYEPLIRDSPEAKQKIEAAKQNYLCHQMKQVKAGTKSPEASRAVMTKPPPPSHLYLVTVGAYQKDGTCNNEILAVNLSQNFRSVSLGHIKPELSERTNCCIDKGDLFIGCLGSKQRKIWKFHLQKRSGTGTLHTRLRTPRRGHGMITHTTGSVYIVGGYNPLDNTSTASVETVNPSTSTSHDAGKLQPFDCPDYNVRCCEVEGGDLAVVGALDAQLQTTLQLWSPSTASTKVAVSLGHNVKSIHGILHVRGHIIIVASGGTLVGRVVDIPKDKPDRIRISDKYKAPNFGSAVVLTPQDHILLLGGKSRGRGVATHSSYQACVQDVINNTGKGWIPLETQFPLANCYIYGYDTTDMQLEK